jgi:uncharacterized Rossmann fold enzyme
MRDLSEQGWTFLDRSSGENTIVYSVPTPLGYRVYISRQRLQHVRARHHSTAQRIRAIPQILADPDIIVPDYDQPDTHLYYKAYGQRLLAIVVHVHLGRRYWATMHWDRNIKGLGRKRIVPSDFLYVQGGFKWNKWR